MPTATRRQWHRNRHSAEQTIDVPSDVQQTPTLDMDAVIAENMEHMEHDIDEDESDEGNSIGLIACLTLIILRRDCRVRAIPTTWP